MIRDTGQKPGNPRVMDEVHGSHREKKKKKKTHICIQAIMWITKGEAERFLTSSTPHTPTPTPTWAFCSRDDLAEVGGLV
ncbi:unnamed protein product [Boreogadus saida]